VRGFVKGSGTSNAIHVVRIMLERHREKNVVHESRLHKAFNRVPHNLIWHGVPHTGRWVKMLYNTISEVIGLVVE